jgi:hypothetical protein
VLNDVTNCSANVAMFLLSPNRSTIVISLCYGRLKTRARTQELHFGGVALFFTHGRSDTRYRQQAPIAKYTFDSERDAPQSELCRETTGKGRECLMVRPLSSS